MGTQSQWPNKCRPHHVMHSVLHLSLPLLVPSAIPVLHTDLIAQQDLSPSTLPAAISRAGQHEAAGRIEVDGRDDAAAVAGHDGEGNGAVARGLGLGNVVDAEDVVGSTASVLVGLMRKEEAKKWRCGCVVE
jgi:hypothetical protein